LGTAGPTARCGPGWRLALAALLLLCHRAPASLYLQDGINYPAGTDLGSNPPWTNATNCITVSSGGLTYSNLPSLSPTGNMVAVAQNSTAAFSYRPFETKATNGLVYFSFLINFTSLPGNFYIAGLTQSTNTSPAKTADPLDLIDETYLGGYTLGIRCKDGTSFYVTNSLSPLALNTTYLVVMKYNFTNGAASLYLNPSIGGAEPASPDASSTNANGLAPDLYYVYFRAGASSSGNTFNAGTIRVGSTWADVTPQAPAAQLAFTTSPASTNAGATLAGVVVQLQDASGINVASNNVPITVALDTGAPINGTTTVSTDAGGKATFNNLVITNANSNSDVLLASASGIGTGLAPVTSGLFTISPGPIDYYLLSASSPRAVKIPFSVTVTALDSYGNTVTTDNSTQVTLTGTGSLEFDGNGNGVFGQAGDNQQTPSAGAFTIPAEDNVAETVSITATDANAKTGTITGLTIVDAELLITLPGQTFTAGSGNSGSPAEQLAGSLFTITLSAVNSSNLVDTTYTGAKTLSFTGPGGTPSYPASVTFANGVGTASITLTLAQTAAISATDNTRAGIPSSSLTVIPATLAGFSFGPISSQIAGQAFNVTIAAQDAYNNTVPGFSGTVNLTTTAGTISPATSAAFVAGVCSQSVTVTSAGSQQTITATRTGGSQSGTSGAFIVASSAVADPAGQLSDFLTSLRVDLYWLAGASVNWLTGAAGGTGPNMTQGTSTHCSAFAAAVADLLGVYILRQPDASDLNLANNQADWLKTNQMGWVPISTMVAAQQTVNTGALVVASYKASSGSGHIAVLRPSTNSDAVINAFGPEECQSGTYNYNDTNVATGFNQHPGAFPSNILYYAHAVSYPLGQVNPWFSASSRSNGLFHAGVSSVTGRKYTLQGTTNFSTWTNLLAYTNSNSSSNFFCPTTVQDPSSAAPPRRFYRLLAE
jgi:hypothetical protein